MSAKKEMSDQQLFLSLLHEDFPSFLAWAFEVLNPGTPYQQNWHIDAICHQLMRCYRGEIQRLLITMPPRYLKSLTVTIAWAAWVLGKHPELKFLCASYAEKLSLEHAEDFRTLTRHPVYKSVFPGLELADNSPLDMLRFTQQGYRMATSVGAAATGFGCDWLICDDLNRADSTAGGREKAIAFFQKTLMSRFNDKKTGVAIVVAQRTAIDDLPGFLQDAGGWEHLDLPAIAPRTMNIAVSGKLKREFSKGCAIHPEREDLETLARIRQEMGEKDFNAQYLQRPHGIEDMVINTNWFPFVEALDLHRYKYIIFSVDTGFTDSATADYTVIAVFGYRDGKSDLLDVWRSRCTYEPIVVQLDKMIKKYNPSHFIVERSGYGYSLLQNLYERYRDMGGIKPYQARLSKIDRVGHYLEYLRSGAIRFVKDAPYLATLLPELSNFPNAMHDDQVDVLTQYCSYAQVGWGHFSSNRLLPRRDPGRLFSY